MRRNWKRTTPVIGLNRTALDQLIATAFPSQTVVAAEHTNGGLANTNIKVQLSNYDHPILVRLYTRDASQALKEFNLLKRIQNRVPVPHVFKLIDREQHPAVLMEFIEDATTFDHLFDNLSEQDLIDVAGAIGKALAAVHSVKFNNYGFFDSELNIPKPMPMNAAGFIEFVHHYLFVKHAQEHLGFDLTDDLVNFVERRGQVLDTWTGEPCLTHSDFGPTNMLLRNTGKSWEVAAILDWEFAFSGTPFFDFGNLLRSPIGEVPGFEFALAQSYTTHGGTLPPNWREMSRLIDLTAWLDFLTRPDAGPEVIEDARMVVRQTIGLQ